jgi:gluconate kinase
MVEGSTVAQAYYVITQTGTITDTKLADLWLNSDALHTQLIQSAIGKGMSLTDRTRLQWVSTRASACAWRTLCGWFAAW